MRLAAARAQIRRKSRQTQCASNILGEPRLLLQLAQGEKIKSYEMRPDLFENLVTEPALVDLEPSDVSDRVLMHIGHELRRSANWIGAITLLIEDLRVPCPISSIRDTCASIAP